MNKSIDSLLDRSLVSFERVAARNALTGQCVMVTGAGGLIGAGLVKRLLLCNPSHIILVDRSESALFQLERETADEESSIKVVACLGDVSDVSRIEAIFRCYPPDRIYHAAAYKHVSMLERHPSEAVLCNVLATKILADLAIRYEVKKFIMISTDKAVNPAGIMGCSKRIAEMYLQALNEHGPHTTCFVVVRFANVIGSPGSVVPLFQEQISNRKPVTVTHPSATRFFMTLEEACQLTIEAGHIGQGGEIIVPDLGHPMSVVSLAKKMICAHGLVPEKDIAIVYIGMREGEKMHEKLIAREGKKMATCHDRLYVAVERFLPYSVISQKIILFEKLVQRCDATKIKMLMKELIPSYGSEVIDDGFESLENIV